MSEMVVMYMNRPKNSDNNIIDKVDFPDRTSITRIEGENWIDLTRCIEFKGCPLIIKWPDPAQPGKYIDSEKLILTDVSEDPEVTKLMGKKSYRLVFDEVVEKDKKEDKVEKPNVGPENNEQLSSKSMMDNKDAFVIPEREHLIDGDVCILTNVSNNKPMGYVRVEHVTPSKIIGFKEVGILLLTPGRAMYSLHLLPDSAITLRNPTAFSEKGTPFSLKLSYFPLLKKRTITPAVMNPPKVK